MENILEIKGLNTHFFSKVDVIRSPEVTHCRLAFDNCNQEKPQSEEYGVEQRAACWLLETGISGGSKISDEYRNTQALKLAGYSP